MKKLILLTTVFFFAVFTVGLTTNSSSAAAPVTTSADLILALQNDVDIILGEDIDMTGTAVGTAPIVAIYSKTFDGNGKTVSNYDLDLSTTTTTDLAGAFIGSLASTGTVENVTFDNISLKLGASNDNGEDHGAIIGYVDGTVNNVSVTDSTVEVDANVTAISAVGILTGLLGTNGSITNTDVVNSKIIVDATSKVNNTGLLVGVQRAGSTINNSSATGTITALASNGIGGLVGFTYGTITNSMADVAINGNLRLGGLVGVAEAGSVITNNFAVGSIQANNPASSTI